MVRKSVCVGCRMELERSWASLAMLDISVSRVNEL